MMPAPYALRLALQSLFREKWINLLSILTIASGLFIISLALLFVYNMEAATKKLPERFSMVLYLDENIPREKTDQIIGSLKKNRSISSVRYISKDAAMKEMKALLKDSEYVFEGLDENPLPDSLEVKIRKEEVSPEKVKKLAEEALRIKGVKEVDYGEKYLSALLALKAGVKAIGGLIIIILSTGITFVCYSTVKILFYRRKEEIETFKLLGATKGFIRTPFLLEGAVIGAIGGAASLLGILSLHFIVFVRIGQKIPFFKSVLFPVDQFLVLPLVGLFLGIAGAAIAIGRLRY